MRRENDYVRRARVIGDSNFKIVFAIGKLNVLPSIIVRATLASRRHRHLDAAAPGVSRFRRAAAQPPSWRHAGCGATSCSARSGLKIYSLPTSR